MIVGLCGLDDFIKRVALVRVRRAAAEHDVREFVEAKHPDRKLEAVGIDNLRGALKKRRVLIVRIEDEDAQIGPCRNRAADEHRRGSRLAHPGRPEHREMPRDQLIHADFRGDAVVLTEPADFNSSFASERIDGPKVFGLHSARHRAEGRVGADAAVKDRRIGGAVDDLPAQFECDASEVRLRFGPPRVDGRDLAYDADKPRVAMRDRDQMADGPILARRVKTAIDDAVRPVQRHKAPDDALRSRLPSPGDAGFLGGAPVQGLACNLQTALEPLNVPAVDVRRKAAGVDLARGGRIKRLHGAPPSPVMEQRPEVGEQALKKSFSNPEGSRHSSANSTNRGRMADFVDRPA